MDEFKIGKKVELKRDPEWTGFIMQVDDENITFDQTTCLIVWGVESYEEAQMVDRSEWDIQWTNKLCVIDEANVLSWAS